jgi:hypothetical protein
MSAAGGAAVVGCRLMRSCMYIRRWPSSTITSFSYCIYEVLHVYINKVLGLGIVSGI